MPGNPVSICSHRQTNESLYSSDFLFAKRHSQIRCCLMPVWKFLFCIFHHWYSFWFANRWVLSKALALMLRSTAYCIQWLLMSKDVTLPTKIHMLKAMLFPGVMYRYESWTIKEAEHQRIDAFKLCCWRSPLRVPWARINPKGNQHWIFIARIVAEAEALITLTTWCKELTHWKGPWLLGKIEGKRRRGWQRMR